MDTGPNETAILSLLEAVWAFGHSLQTRSKHMQRTVGLTGGQRTVIRMLELHPKVSAGELARTLHMHPSTLTGVLSRLEKRGLIRRDTDPDDDRKVILTVTAEGRQFDKPHPESVEARVSTYLASVSADEGRRFELQLRALTTIIGS